MEIQTIIMELIHNQVIQSEPTNYQQLTGGTVSKLYLLHVDEMKYVVKLNAPEINKSEAEFLYFYKESTLLPGLLYVEPSYRYTVYSFINGSTNYARKNKKEMLQMLVQRMINHYKPAPGIGWGWADQPVDSWRSFILNEIFEAKEVIDSRLDSTDHNYVLSLAEKISLNRRRFLLHGDCGVHNFIFNDGKLSGVIDPTPVIGAPHYDLIYAFCSSPDDLTKETIDSALNLLKENDRSIFYEEVVIGLYLRLRTCMKHHPHDFDEYLNAWHYWVDITRPAK